MTSSDKENLERKLDHVFDMGQMLVEQYKHITCTERTALMLALLAAVKQVSCNVATVRELLASFIIDTFRVDYSDYAWKFRRLHTTIMTTIAGAPMVDALDTSQKPIIGTDRLVMHENNQYHISDCKNIDRLPQIQTYLINHAAFLNDEILDGIQLIIADLEGINSDYYRLNENEHLLNETFHNLKLKYEESAEADEQDKMDELVEALDYYMTKHGNSIKHITRFIENFKHDCSELTECYFEGFSPAKELLKKRSKYTFDDVRRFFFEIKAYDMLQDAARQIAMAEGNDEYYRTKPGDRVFNVFGHYIENQFNYYNK